jgi:hypothetical protein
MQSYLGRELIGIQTIMLARASNVNRKSYSSFFAQRVLAAFRAISDLLSGVSLAARSIPPFLAPRLLSATACGFFRFLVIGKSNVGMLTGEVKKKHRLTKKFEHSQTMIRLQLAWQDLASG